MTAPRLLNLALQGGGAHGAFTWGVLDALLEDGRVAFDGLSGTSAGAMNAVVLAQGWMAGGRDGARAALRRFWTTLADTMPLDVTRHDADGGVHLAPAVRFWMAWAHYVTPAQFNPLDVNPLRDIARRPGGLRAPARRVAVPAVRRGDACRFGSAAPVRCARAERGRGAGIGLPAGRVPRAQHRRLHVLGRRLCRQPGGISAAARRPIARHLAGAAVTAGMAADAAHDTARALQARVAEIAFTAAFRREMQALVRERAHARTARGRWWLPRAARRGRGRAST